MGTKIIPFEITQDDMNLVISLGRTPRERRLVSLVVRNQCTWCANESAQGILRSKEWHSMFRTWVEDGCPEPSSDYHKLWKHGLKAKLAHIQYYILSLNEKDRIQAINIFMTAFRTYQSWGLNTQELERSWVSKTLPNIRRPIDQDDLDSMLLGLCSPDDLDQAPNEEAWEACRSVRLYFDDVEKRLERYEKWLVSGRQGNCPASKSDLAYRQKLNITTDERALVKASPHDLWLIDPNKGTKTKQPFKSVLSAEFDVFALSRPVVKQEWTESISISQLRSNQSEEAKVLQMFVFDDSETYLDLIEKLEAALCDLVDTNQFSGSKYPRVSPQEEICFSNGKTKLKVVPHIGHMFTMADKGGKERTCATATYTENRALRPIHDFLMAITKAQPFDCTDQPKADQFLKSWTEETDAAIGSSDLTAATDRLPLLLEAYVLYRLLRLNYPAEKALKVSRYWFLLMESTVYFDPVTGEEVQYAAGQAMGLLSSWPILACTNRSVGKGARYQPTLGKKDKRHMTSLICGDDILSKSTSLDQIRRYNSRMTAIGVKVNASKSHLTSETDKVKIAEFTKKEFRNGQKISGASPKLLISAMRNPGLIPNALELVQDVRGCSLSLKELENCRVKINRSSLKTFIPIRYGGLGIRDDRSRLDVLLYSGFLETFLLRKIETGYASLLKLEFETTALHRRIPVETTQNGKPKLSAKHRQWIKQGKALLKGRPGSFRLDVTVHVQKSFDEWTAGQTGNSRPYWRDLVSSRNGRNPKIAIGDYVRLTELLSAATIDLDDLFEIPTLFKTVLESIDEAEKPLVLQKQEHQQWNSSENIEPFLQCSKTLKRIRNFVDGSSDHIVVEDQILNFTSSGRLHLNGKERYSINMIPSSAKQIEYLDEADRAVVFESYLDDLMKV